MSEKDIEQYNIIEHPLEDVFGVPNGSTLLPSTTLERTELVDAETFDEKDKEIEQQFQEVYEAAMCAFNAQCEISETIDTKFKARNDEVSVQFLQAALNAAKEKSALKQHKDKLSTKRQTSGPKNLTQNVVVADRNDILRQLLTANTEDTTK